MSTLKAAVYGRDVEREGWPTVSVVMPVRNEADGLEAAVASILTQDYPLPFDVCLAIGPSDDGTEAIADALAEREPRVHVVPNPTGVTPAALNAAIAATNGEIVVRVDGHSKLSDGYIKRAVETMIETGAVNVGGIQDAQGETPFEEAVAASMKSWIGTGGAKFHVGGDPGPVDTVYLGVFDRVAGDQVGWFDPRLIRNQDYELNIRLRKANGVIWFDPTLSVTYRPRGSWNALAKQYYEYGYWKAEVLRMHPESLKARQLAPLGLLAALVSLACKPNAASGAVAGCYVAALGTSLGRFGRAAMLGAATAHFAWPVGFLYGLVSSTRTASRQPRRRRVLAS